MRDMDIQSLKRPRHKARSFQTQSNYDRQTYVKLTNQLKSKTKEAKKTFHKKRIKLYTPHKSFKSYQQIVKYAKKISYQLTTSIALICTYIYCFTYSWFDTKFIRFFWFDNKRR